MKVTLDLDRLIEKGEISRDEYDKMLRLSASETGSLGFNILIAFGEIAISGGLLALFPTPTTSMLIGLIVGGVGLTLGIQKIERWKLLASISTLVGALMLGGGILMLEEG